MTATQIIPRVSEMRVFLTKLTQMAASEMKTVTTVNVSASEEVSSNIFISICNSAGPWRPVPGPGDM